VRHTDSDLVRLRQFLKTLEAEAKIAVGDIDPNTREIESLKREIAYLERVQQDGPDVGRNSASDCNRLRRVATGGLIT
jgi:ribosomal protein L29